MRIVKIKQVSQSARILPIRVKQVTTEENQRVLYRSRDSIRARFFSSENAYLKRARGTGGGRDSMDWNFREASSDQPSCLGSSCSGVGIGACC